MEMVILAEIWVGVGVGVGVGMGGRFDFEVHSCFFVCLVYSMVPRTHRYMISQR